MRRSLVVIAILSALSPFTAHAAVVISEIMYDLPGSDENREWIELYNNGVEIVDLEDWRFFEGGVNHKILPRHALSLMPNSYVVIVRHVDGFKTDWPLYDGALFVSSFSLNNTGENLTIKNANLETIFSLAYTNNVAAGDGNSLNLIQGELASRRPTPGMSIADEPLTIPKVVTSLAEAAPVSDGNLSTQDEVRETGAIDGGGMDRGVYAASFVAGEEQRPRSIFPWIASLIAVMGLGFASVLWRKRKSKSGYTIIEEEV